jgi:hydrogenase nickel incorporation protein HypA/HybF
VHELSIAVSLVDLASAEADLVAPARVDVLHVRIGVLAGVVRESLLFSFDVAAAGTAIEGARLEIQQIPATVWCATCQAKQTLANVQRRRCPVCDSPTPQLLTGEELQLVSMEVVEDAGENSRGSKEHPAQE